MYTPTGISHSDTNAALYETCIAGQRNLDMYVQA